MHTALEKLTGLTSLEVVNGRESFDLSVASEFCPKLQSLQVFYSRGVHISSSQGLRFPNLKKLTIYATEASSVSVSDHFITDLGSFINNNIGLKSDLIDLALVVQIIGFVIGSVIIVLK